MELLFNPTTHIYMLEVIETPTKEKSVYYFGKFRFSFFGLSVTLLNKNKKIKRFWFRDVERFEQSVKFLKRI